MTNEAVTYATCALLGALTAALALVAAVKRFNEWALRG